MPERARENLIRQAYGTILADEVLIPAHSAIWRGFPGLAAEPASVHHDRRNMLAAGRSI